MLEIDYIEVTEDFRKENLDHVFSDSRKVNYPILTRKDDLITKPE
jgi:hypothetical protein